MANLHGGLVVSVTWNKVVDYAHIEASLIGVGFTEYLIDRSVVAGQTEATISVHLPTELITAEGVPEMDAVATLRSLADAIADVDTA